MVDFENCAKCGKVVTQGAQQYKFCPHCGQLFEAKKNLPYIGKHTDAAIYRITFDPVEVECTSEAAAEERAEDSIWDGDREFPGYTVERIISAVANYPYICSACWYFMSRTTEGRCKGCGKTQWEKVGKGEEQ